MPKVDSVIAAYIKLRDEKARIKAEADEKCNALTDSMLKLEAWIKQQADLMGVAQFRTDSGTAFFKTEDYTSVADWDMCRNFIIENQAYDLLEKRVSKTAVKSMLDATGQLPPGINYSTRIVMNVRRPNAKVDGNIDKE